MHKFIIRVLMLCVQIVNMNTLTLNKPSVVIIGAGPAGIAAASRLLQNNITNVKIVEAEERIGGRIYSIQFEDSMLDLGAEWCHAERNNVVYELVKNYNLLDKTDTWHVFYNSRNEVVNEDDVKELYSIFFSIYNNKQNYENISLNEYMITKYNQVIKERYKCDKQKLKVASEFLYYIKNKLLITTGALSLNDVSAESDYVETEGNQTLNWKGKGHKILLDVLLKRYPNPEQELSLEGKLFLNKKVNRISWNKYNVAEKVQVSCDDGSEFDADFVIWTPSLGVLKADHNQIFRPPLPEEKLSAINKLGMGGVAKMFLYYSSKWWPSEKFESFYLIWDAEDKAKITEEFPFGPTLNGESWLANLIGFSSVTKHPNLVLVWFLGELVPVIELLPEQTIIDGTDYILNKFLSHKFQNITKADTIFRHCWYNNPNFRGTYSYQTLLSDKGEMSDEIILSKPLISCNGKTGLLFAGEATSDIHYGTVHGAVESGFREADRIIHIYSNE